MRDKFLLLYALFVADEKTIFYSFTVNSLHFKILEMTMLNRNIVLIGIAFSILCLIMASLYYPGGSPKDSHSVGFQWTENYISDMLEYKAVNGSDNTARPLAVAGVVLMGLCTGFAFVRFARKVGLKKYSFVIQYGGLLMILLTALGTAPLLHDLSVTLSIFLNLLVFFYVMIVLLKSRLLVFKVLSVVFLASFYGASYMFGTKTGLEYMPLVQKITHVVQIIWILGLEYFTRKEDFEHLT
jgi:hypothetical protein